MPADIRVPMPRPGEDLQVYFDEMVDNNAFGSALDFSVVEFDELARLADVRVTAVETSDAGIAVHYAVSWDAFHACDDRTIKGDHARVVRGTVDGRDWLFARAAQLPERSTLDEF